MTDLEKLVMLRSICGYDVEEMSDTILTTYLNMAEGIVIRHCFPLLPNGVNAMMPEKYNTLQVQIANELIQKRGAEGEKSHNENGVNRSYETAGVSKSLLQQITPCARVITATGEVKSE